MVVRSRDGPSGVDDGRDVRDEQRYSERPDAVGVTTRIRDPLAPHLESPTRVVWFFARKSEDVPVPLNRRPSQRKATTAFDDGTHDKKRHTGSRVKFIRWD